MHKEQDQVQDIAQVDAQTPTLLEAATLEEEPRKNSPGVLKKFWWKCASKLRRFSLWVFNPSRLLRLLLLLLFLAFVALIALRRGWIDWVPLASLAVAKAEVKDVDWVATTTIYFAVSGWLVNAIVTIRNSVKQHTINTLLQSRLSKTYMDEGDKARTALKPFSPDKIAPAAFIKNHSEKNSVDYVLNYIEFIAVGMRHGDLHEGVLKDSMRSIVLSFTGICSLYIEELRARPNSRTFENLIWLRKRWA